MRSTRLFLLGAGCAVVAAWLSAAPAAGQAVSNLVPAVAIPFSLTNVTLLNGPFQDAMLRDKAYLLSLDTNRLLYNFRHNVGLSTHGAQPYGNWESPSGGLCGHFVGHYLSACSEMYAATGDPQCKARTDYLVGELATCQAADAAAGYNTGYLAAYPEADVNTLIAGGASSIWSPWYPIHKIMAGLLDAYQYCGNTQALTVLSNEANWVQFKIDPLTSNQITAMLNTEYGGMNEVLANLYAITGNTNNLRIARDFDYWALFTPLSRDEDTLDPYHVNTQVPKMIGAAREYELTGLTNYQEIAHFFWERVALHRSFVIGCPGNNEYFFNIADFPENVGPADCETCNVYNLLKLSHHIFSWAADPAVMDYYERALFNDILASQEPQEGMMTYFMSLAPGHFKTYSTQTDSFWCCVGTGVENHAKYGDSIYYYGSNSLYVNLFIASQLNWGARRLVVTQNTTFPQSNTSLLSFQCANPVSLALKIRYPSWAPAGMTVTVNGVQQIVTNPPGSFVTVQRTWQDGDQAQIQIPMTLRTETLQDTSNTVALFYGPVLLAGELGTNAMPASDFAANQGDLLAWASLSPPAPEMACGGSAGLISNTAPVAGQSLTFQTQGIGLPYDVTLIPFYQTHHQRYSVYWRLLSPAALLPPPPATLIHRYSFTSDASDSVGVADGTLGGDAVISNGTVVLDGSGYVQLPGDFCDGLTNVTFEFWLTWNGGGQWQHIFDFGNNNGANGNGFGGAFHDINLVAKDGGAATDGGNLMSVIVINGYGVQSQVGVPPMSPFISHHLVWTYDDLSSLTRLYLDGVQAGEGAMTDSFHEFSDSPNCWLGQSQYGPIQDPDFNGTIDEFRIYDGTLSAAAVASDYTNGPNNTGLGNLVDIRVIGRTNMLAGGAGQQLTVVAHYQNFSGMDITANSQTSYSVSDPSILAVTPTGFLTALAPATNPVSVTIAFRGKTASLIVHILSPAPPVLIHRYSFTSDASDSVGTANGALEGDAVCSNGAVVLNGNAYVQLPANFCTNLTNVTFEFWLTWNGGGQWQHIFDFGRNDGANGNGFGNAIHDINLVPDDGPAATDGGNHMSLIVINGMGVLSQVSVPPLTTGVEHQVVWTYDTPSTTAAIYVDGVLAGTTTNMTDTFAGFADCPNCWLGQSQYGPIQDPDFNGTIDEFRIYGGTFTSQQAAFDYAKGPNIVAYPISLAASLLNGQIILSWPVVNSSGYVLQSSPVLGTGASWSAAGSATVTNGQNQIAVPSGGGARFYRLKR